MLLTATRVLDPTKVPQFVQSLLDDQRTLFQPGSSVTTVTSGGVQYGCISGVVTKTGVGQVSQIACGWGTNSIAFDIVAVGLDQQAVLALAPQAQAGTG